MKYLRFIILLVALILVLFLALSIKKCSIRKNNVLRIAFTSMPATLDPLNSTEHFTSIVTQNIYESLFDINDEGIDPVLAESWYNPTENEIIFILRKNVYFHNGKLFTAIDARASIQRIVNQVREVEGGIAPVDSIEVLDTYRLKVRYHSDLFDVMQFIAQIYMYDSDMIEQFDGDYLKKHPVGTGEYYVAGYTKDKIELVHFSSYWRPVKCYDKVIINYIPSMHRQVKLLLSGKLDFIMNPPFTYY